MALGGTTTLTNTPQTIVEAADNGNAPLRGVRLFVPSSNDYAAAVVVTYSDGATQSFTLTKNDPPLDLIDMDRHGDGRIAGVTADNAVDDEVAVLHHITIMR